MIDAAARGVSDGMHLALNVAAMLIAFLGLIAMINGILGGIHSLARDSAGFPHRCSRSSEGSSRPSPGCSVFVERDCATVGNLLGTRLILNEFVAYVDLGKIGSTFSTRDPVP